MTRPGRRESFFCCQKGFLRNSCFTFYIVVGFRVRRKKSAAGFSGVRSRRTDTKKQRTSIRFHFLFQMFLQAKASSSALFFLFFFFFFKAYLPFMASMVTVSRGIKIEVPTCTKHNWCHTLVKLAVGPCACEREGGGGLIV